MSIDGESFSSLASAAERFDARGPWSDPRALARRLFRADAVALFGLLVWTALGIALAVRLSARTGGSFTGTETGYPPDSFQFLAWVRDAGLHGLIGDNFQLGRSYYDFLQPMFLISGLLWRAGLSLPFAYLIWAPIGAVLTWWGFRALIRRHLSGWSAHAAMALALCYLSPLAALAWERTHAYGQPLNLGYELSSMGAFWEYFPRTIAVASLPALLLCLEGILEPRRRAASGRSIRVYALGAAGAACVAAWLHPWQGAVAVMIVIGIALWARPKGKPLLALGLPVIGAALPLLYYEALNRLDADWKAGNAQSFVARFSPEILAAAFLPLVVLALIRVDRSFLRGTGHRLLVVWIAAVAVGYWGPWSYAPHMLDGVALPLSILAVKGWTSPRLGRWLRRIPLHPRPARRIATVLAVAGVLLCCLPAPYIFAAVFRTDETELPWGMAFTASDNRALTYLASSRVPGGVLAPIYITAAVPAFTGRNTFDGHFAWTPQDGLKESATVSLFFGDLSSSDTRAFVRKTGARFVLIDCSTNNRVAQRTGLSAAARMSSILGGDIVSERVFGCASVYQLRS